MNKVPSVVVVVAVNELSVAQFGSTVVPRPPPVVSYYY